MGAGHEQENLTPTTAPLDPGKQRNRFFAWLHRHFPEGRDKAAAGAAVFSFCAVVLSLSAFLMTLLQNKAVNAVAVASTFSNLRAHYHDIDAKLPTNYTEENVRYPKGSANWQIVRRYWDNTFDEWFVSTKLNDGGVEDLWKKFYAEAVGLSLRYPAMRDVYCNLGYGGRNQTKVRREFHAALLQEFAAIEPGTTLCPVPEPGKLFHS